MAIYYKLFHGRKSPDDDMDDWGTSGPTIGPFTFYAETYNEVQLIRDPGCRSRQAYGNAADYPEDWICFNRCGDLIFFRGVYYGDREVYSGEPLEEPIWVRREDFIPSEQVPGAADAKIAAQGIRGLFRYVFERLKTAIRQERTK